MMLCMLALELMTALSALSAPPAPDVINNTSDSSLDKCDVRNCEGGFHIALTLLLYMNTTDVLIHVESCVFIA